MADNTYTTRIERIKKVDLASAFLALCLVFLSPGLGECAEKPKPEEQRDAPEIVEVSYDGKMIKVDVRDLILMSDGKGGQKVELTNPEDYADQLDNYKSVPPYSEDLPAPVRADGGGSSNVQEITEREYREEQRARQWANVVEDLNLRDIDQKALELVKEFGSAKGAVPPATGSAGTLVMTYSSYTPKIVCRPMYVTDVILQPGELVTGVHPGDPVRWTFVPSRSGTGGFEQTHVLIKPLMADISTNLIINTDRRTYQLDLVSSAKNFIPSVSFVYPADSLNDWNIFIAEKKKERDTGTVLSSGYSVNPEDLHMDYAIKGGDTLRWKPVRVWDDGVKTYIQFKKGSTRKSVEAPVFVIFEHKKEIIVNYRALEDMYVVDRVFTKGALILGTGAHQDRVVIARLSGK